jgi:hypothetical protein
MGERMPVYLSGCTSRRRFPEPALHFNDGYIERQAFKRLLQPVK